MVKHRYTLRLYVVIKRVFDEKYNRLVVSDKTSLCVEGYPRCANSYFFNVFNRANPGLVVARHLHYPQQILDSVSLDIPCVVLYRHPLDCIASLACGMPKVPINMLVDWYVFFYSRCLGVAHYEKLVFVSFSEVLNNFSGCVNRINDVAGTSFNVIDVNRALDAEIFESLTKHAIATNNESLTAVPSKEKDSKKEAKKQKILASKNFEKALKIYEDIKEAAKYKK